MTPDIAIFSPIGRSGTSTHGGITTVVTQLAEGFCDLGRGVELVTFAPEDPRRLVPRLDPRVAVTNLGRGTRLAHLLALRAWLAQRRPRVLLAAGHRPNLIAALAKRLLSAPPRVVLSVHNTPGPGLASLGPLGRQLRLAAFRHVYPGADGIVCVSAGVADDLSRHARIPRERLAVIHNPILTPAALARAEADPGHPWLVPGAPPVILGAGRLSAQKDFATLLRAFARLPAASGLRLMILGEGAERPALLRLAAELGIAERTALPGFVEEPMAYMRRARLFVLSSAWEGFGNVLVEAMAVGTPVVATDCPSGPREILQDGALGPLVPPGDPAALAAAMAAALERPADPLALRRRAADFGAEAAARRYLAVLDGPGAGP